MYSLQIILNGNNYELKTNDSVLEIRGVITIPYENIINIDYKKGGLMSKSKIIIDFLDNGFQNNITVETKEKYNSCIQLINLVKDNQTNNQNEIRTNVDSTNKIIQNNNLINNHKEKPIYSIKVGNGPIKGDLEIYENYLKVVCKSFFNVIYYNQMIKAEKIKQTPSAFLVFHLRTDIDEIFEHEWLVDKLFGGKKVDKIIDYVNNKIMQCNQNNDIQVINVITNPNSNNKIFFMGSISEVKSSLTGRTNQEYASISYLMEEYLLIEKLSLFSKTERGDKKIPYERISSIDYDKPTTFGITSGIDITLSGSDVVSLKSVNDKSTENFYRLLTRVVDENRKPQVTQVIHQETTTNADELLKWYDLYEKGVISEEELNQKKKELL